MSSWVVINGVLPWDGRYPLDFEDEFTQREWGWIKRYAGYASPLDMGPHAATEPEMIGIYGLIALHRNHKVETRDIPDVWERFQDAKFPSSITLENDPSPVEEDDAGPPPGSSEPRRSSNGAGSTTASESSDVPTAATGPPRSDTSESGLEMSVT